VTIADQAFGAALDVGTGKDHGCAVRTDGTVWCWGANESGQLGTGAPATGTSEPRQVPGVDGVASVHPLEAATCVRKRDGTAWCWGEGFSAAPVRLLAASGQPLSGVTAVRGSARSQHACALRADRRAKFAGIGEKAVELMAHDEWTAFVDETPALIAQLANRLVKLDVRAAPRKNDCGFCELKPLCRYDRWSPVKDNA
jgi:hypothetical protein